MTAARPGRLPLLAVLAGFALLPWHMQQDSVLALGWLGNWASDPAAASGLLLAARLGHPWLWPVGVAGAASAVALLLPLTQRRRGATLVAAGLFGLLAMAAQGFAVTGQGWGAPWLDGLFGPLPEGQFGMGAGAALTGAGFLFLATTGAALRGAFRGDRFTAGAAGLVAAVVLLFTFWPIALALLSAFDGGVDQFLARAADRRLWGWRGSATNTLLLGLSVAACTTALGLAFALLVTRTRLPLRRTLRALTVLPIITPPFVIGLGLILILGRAGLVNQAAAGLFGVDLGRWIYGLPGVLLAQVFSFTPVAFLVLIGVVEGLSPTLEEAARTLRADGGRTFRTVTLPLLRPGLANAFLVGFIESVSDFGNPIVLGGDFGVLSTDIYFAVVGAQADPGRAAVLAWILLGFSLATFAVQRRLTSGRGYVSISGKGDAGLPQPLPAGVRRLCLAVALPWAALTATVYALALAGGFVRVWGRDWTPTLSHYGRAFSVGWGPGGPVWTGTAWSSLFVTLELAAIAAPLTALVGLLAAWLFTRQEFRGKRLLEGATLLSFAVPGTVIGVAYVRAFNVPPFELTGTGVIIVLAFLSRNLPVGLRAGMAAFAQLDPSLDEASTMLRHGGGGTLRRVLLPLLRPAVAGALVYGFVRGVTTVSAVIFLTSGQTEMATVFIVLRVVNGDYGVAIAYASVLIVLMLAAIGLIGLLVGARRLGRRVPAAVTL